MQEVAENIWVLRYPLSLAGARIGRTVTIIRLGSGKVVIHSSGPFTPQDVRAIHSLGQPGWLVEATTFHETFTSAGRMAFPGVPYAAPDGLLQSGETMSLRSPPAAWADEIEILAIEGMPRVQEHCFFHRPTRTLIVADLLFNFGPGAPGWTRWFFPWFGGVRQPPGMSRLFRLFIRDRHAFAESMQRIMNWDFNRLIVAHGDIVESGARQKLATALGLGAATQTLQSSK